MDASALVVGIDGYTGVPELSGSAKDAIDVTNWLLSIGVQPTRIYLHIAPRHQEPLVPPPGLTPKSATRDEIWSSIYQISQQQGDRLYVFLSGHGYYLPETGPIFLTQDFKLEAPAKNLDIFSFIKFFLSFSFPSQFLLFDACENFPNDPIYRSTIFAAGPDIGGWTPKERENGLILCTAASQGQFAPLIDGRGLLTRHLVDALTRSVKGTLPLEAQDAIQYDWQTGARTLDLGPLFNNAVAPAIAVVAAKNNSTQTPTIQPHGRFTSNQTWTFFDLPALPTAPLKISPAPDSRVETIRVELRPPTKALILRFQQTPPTFPYSGLAPQGSRLIVNCIPQSGWIPKPPTEDVPSVPQTGLALDFELTPLGPAGGSSQLNQINLKVITPQGVPTEGISDKAYIVANREIPPPPGVSITKHEDGPDIQIEGTPKEQVDTFVDNLRKKLTSLMREDEDYSAYELFLSPLGKTINESLPNLRLDLPEGGSKALFGFLTSEPLITVERIGDDPSGPRKTLSAQQLTEQSLLRVEPGLYRVRTNAPWGTGLTTVEVKTGSLTACSLPSIVGLPPLRNAVVNTEFLNPYPLLIHEYSSNDLSPTDHIFINGFPRTPIMLQWNNGILRCEPFSTLPWQEWDLLISAGRLDAVNLEAAEKRLKTEPAISPNHLLLLIALAYAARTQGRWDYFDKFMEELAKPTQLLLTYPDIYLLNLDRHDRHSGATLPPPLFRWGIDLIRYRAPNTELPGLPLSTSVWSAFKVTETSNLKTLTVDLSQSGRGVIPPDTIITQAQSYL